MVLTLALSRSWPIHRLDVKNVFLHGTLNETVYYVQPTGFVDSTQPNYVRRLNKSLYGLKQAPRAWHSRFASHITSLGFAEAKSDTSVFTEFRSSLNVRGAPSSDCGGVLECNMASGPVHHAYIYVP
jgi:hypothetical protein